jgi:hypothetical protein
LSTYGLEFDGNLTKTFNSRKKIVEMSRILLNPESSRKKRNGRCLKKTIQKLSTRLDSHFGANLLIGIAIDYISLLMKTVNRTQSLAQSQYIRYRRHSPKPIRCALVTAIHRPILPRCSRQSYYYSFVKLFEFFNQVSSLKNIKKIALNLALNLGSFYSILLIYQPFK